MPLPPDVQAQVVSASYAAKDPDLQAAKPTKGGHHTPVQFFGDCSKGWCVRLSRGQPGRRREEPVHAAAAPEAAPQACKAAAQSPQAVAGS